MISNRKKIIALFLITIISVQVLFPTVAYALTSGPTQPEVQGFQPAGTTEMVDLFTGDFSYNIPLFELPGPNGGYPFNLSYQAGVTMDQEASWVGLGWSLQPGAITRQMRGFPDEFNGDQVKTKMSINKSVTYGLGAGVGLEIFGGDGTLSLGLGFHQNNYRGFGYSIDASVNAGGSTKSGMTGGLSLDLSLDSQEGVGVSPSLNLGYKTNSIGLHADYNSKQGLTGLSLSPDINFKYGKKSASADNKDGTSKEDNRKSGRVNFSASISLAHPGYTPQISMSMKNTNLSAQLKVGGNWWGVSGLIYVKGFYNEQSLNDDKKFIGRSAFGYLNYQNSQSEADMVDFNREKDGMVSKETPNLAMPSLTYDVYSVSGQGIDLMYRPVRNDYGVIREQEVSSTSNALGLGVDIAPGATHIGVNLTLNHSKSTSGNWGGSSNKITSTYQAKQNDKIGEPVYYKVHGETTSESISKLNSMGGEKAVRVQLEDVKENPNANAKLETNRSASVYNLPSYSNTTRPTRNQMIMPITKGELMSAGGVEMLPEYIIAYQDSTGTEKTFNRNATTNDNHLIAGYTALTGDGLRYVYGIPAYNLFQEEAQFSVLPKSEADNRVDVITTGTADPKYDHDGTDEFLKRVQLPKYAHSYLLTSILGPDYVDVTRDGVTPDDLGYWVKFTYKKTTDDFKWRDPYSKAHLNMGWRSDPRDDKGSYTYGKKEMWYLSRAETKTHIADFSFSSRHDGKGVLNRLQDNDDRGKSVSKLDNIKLYSRISGPSNPIKVTRFSYDYSLCDNVNNNDGVAEWVDGVNVNADRGKLTLKKLWFEYGTSTRGKLNPYTFIYSSFDPGYDVLAYDRWGTYKPYPANQKYYNNDFPYSDQDPSIKSQIDANAAAWSLKEIRLPSGGTIMVDYETDDYAYVQNKKAMQMVQMVDPRTAGALQNTFMLDQNNMAVRFKLEKTISGTLTASQQKAEVLKYIDTKTWQLYFKLFVNLRYPSETNFTEYISGYVDVNKSLLDSMKLERDAQGLYAYGRFHVVKERGHNPFSLRAWQHLRTNQPDLANTGKKMEPATSSGDKIDQIKGMGSIGAQISQLFKGFNDYCDDKDWGKKVDATRSWIRLNSPDRIKYGGGLRVKQITMKDNWSQDDEGYYGQVYDYTTTEGSETYSSGVAAYEPMVGGEENAMHYAKKYTQSIPLRTDNNLFFEYPINEGNYPGPQVGYSKVTVLSLAAAALEGRTLSAPAQNVFPHGANISYGTTGKTVHEFYTAKDFPVITEETDKVNRQYKLSLSIPLLGSLSIVKLTTSQGYSIVTNDMHGRQKAVSNYRQAKNGTFEPDAISWVRYNYKAESKTINGERAFALNNVMKDNGDETLRIPTPSDINSGTGLYSMGQEADFTYDMRQYEDNAWGGGTNINNDVLYFVFVTIPIPTWWPSISKSTTRLRIASTNKIIFKSGILESTEAFDGGSRVVTNNKKWDKQTGAVVLTSVNNNFDDLVYNYTLPAFREYQGMGAAYKNVGLTFNMTSVGVLPYKVKDFEFYHSLPAGTLQPGDEFLLYPASGAMEYPVARVVYTGNIEGSETFYSEQSIDQTSYQAMVVRSGFRNQLSVSAATITALQDPSVVTNPVTYSKTIQVPKQ
jgi:hypothetical protein